MDRLWTPWRYSYVSHAGGDERRGIPEALSAWPGDTGCVFCNLLESSAYATEHGMAARDADRAANIVYRGEACFICLNAFPYNSGHVMVLPYNHIAELARLEPTAANEMMTLVQRLESAMNRVYRPDGFNLGMNLGRAAGAGVTGHLHLHMLPRWLGDTNFMTVTGETRVLAEMLETAWEKLTVALDGANTESAPESGSEGRTKL